MASSGPGAPAGFTAVFIEPFEGSGPQRYLLWLATSSEPLYRAVRSLGLPSVHVRDMWMAMQEAVASVTAEGVVPKKDWRGGYGITLDSSPPSPSPGEADAVYRRVGSADWSGSTSA